jgi:hypothetical protein
MNVPIRTFQPRSRAGEADGELVRRPAGRDLDSLPGATPVKKFKDRANAVARIRKAIQNLGQPASAPVSETAPVSDQIRDASDTAQPEAVIPDSPLSAPVTALGPPTPDVAPDQGAAKTC